MDVRTKLIRRKILSLDDLPTISNNVQRLLSMLKDQESDMTQVILEINKDAILVSKILKLVNSGYYNMPQNVTNIDQAVNLVGYKRVWEMIMSTTFMDMMSGAEKSILKHSYACSILARDLVNQYQLRASENFQLTVLMHDIGKMVLREYNNATFNLSIKMAHAESLPVYFVEKKNLGITHSQAGCWLLEHWGLSEDQTKPVLQHHDIDADDYIVETAIIQVCDFVDNTVRGITVDKPHQLILEKAGLGQVDFYPMLIEHTNLLAEIEPDFEVLEKSQKSYKSAAVRSNEQRVN
ncbi:MAG: HDOD domain-containing protein [Lentisphaeria bacterium]|nr:HDOD domain-containing protein [Lentisphaeria bacterium]